MSDRKNRPPLFERVKGGLQEGIEWARGDKELEISEIDLQEPAGRTNLSGGLDKADEQIANQNRVSKVRSIRRTAQH